MYILQKFKGYVADGTICSRGKSIDDSEISCLIGKLILLSPDGKKIPISLSSLSHLVYNVSLKDLEDLKYLGKTTVKIRV